MPFCQAARVSGPWPRCSNGHSGGNEEDLGLVLWWEDLFAEAVLQFSFHGSLRNQSVFAVMLRCILS